MTVIGPSLYLKLACLWPRIETEEEILALQISLFNSVQGYGLVKVEYDH